MLHGIHKYPATFEKGNECYGSRFDDLPATISVEDSVERLIESSREALALTLYSLEEDAAEIPVPSKAGDIQLSEGEWVVEIEVDMDRYNKEVEKMEREATVIRLANVRDASTVKNFMKTHGIKWAAIEEELSEVK